MAPSFRGVLGTILAFASYQLANAQNPDDQADRYVLDCCSSVAQFFSFTYIMPFTSLF